MSNSVTLYRTTLSARYFLGLIRLNIPFPQGQCNRCVNCGASRSPHHHTADIKPCADGRVARYLRHTMRGSNMPMLSGVRIVHILDRGSAIYKLLYLGTTTRSSTRHFILVHYGGIVCTANNPTKVCTSDMCPFDRCNTAKLTLRTKTGKGGLAR